MSAIEVPGRQIDAHCHVLALAAEADFTREYGREGSLCIWRSRGSLPSHRCPTPHEWEEAEAKEGVGFGTLGPHELAAAHPGFDKVIALAMSPQVLDGRLIGTVDVDGVTDVEGEKSPERCNEYIAGCVRAEPERIIGFASVNPVHSGVGAAVEELGRAVEQDGLRGVKLYPMYQHWSPADTEIAFPVFAAARDLGIPVMVHQAGSTRIDAKLEYARPAMLDDVGREFRDLKLIIAHVGTPWVDEAMFLLTKHPHFYTELSYHIATITRRDLFLFLHRAEPSFVPLEKIFFGTDFPGFGYDPLALREKLLTVNEEAPALGLPPLDEGRVAAIMGDNIAPILGLT